MIYIRTVQLQFSFYRDHLVGFEFGSLAGKVNFSNCLGSGASAKKAHGVGGLRKNDYIRFIHIYRNVMTFQRYLFAFMSLYPAIKGGSQVVVIEFFKYFSTKRTRSNSCHPSWEGRAGRDSNKDTKRTLILFIPR